MNNDLDETLTPPSKPDPKKTPLVAIAPVVVPAQVVEVFATSYFATLGLVVCSKCGGKKQTDGNGMTVCSIGSKKADCPMTKEES